jgi:hypothetical protein
MNHCANNRILCNVYMCVCLKQMKREIIAMFGEDPHKSNSYSRIISEGHLERLISYMDHVSNRTYTLLPTT